MHDPTWLLIPFAVVLWACWDGKRVTWVKLPKLMKVTKTKRGTTYSAFRPAQPKSRARKGKR